MPEVVVSPNPKRIKVFMTPNGTLQKGSAEDYYMGHDMARIEQPNRVPEKSKAEEKKN